MFKRKQTIKTGDICSNDWSKMKPGDLIISTADLGYLYSDSFANNRSQFTVVEPYSRSRFNRNYIGVILDSNDGSLYKVLTHRGETGWVYRHYFVEL